MLYLNAMKTGPEEAVEYASFPNDDIRNSFLGSPLYIVDYEIESSEVINEDLHAYTILIQDNYHGDVYRKIYYFVGRTNGNYTVYGNVDYVPESLRTDLDISDFSYQDEDHLGSTPEFSE